MGGKEGKDIEEKVGAESLCNNIFNLIFPHCLNQPQLAG